MAQMSKARTRHASSSLMVEYLGAGKELLPSELPTLRSALLLGIHLQEISMMLEEKDKRNYPVKEMMVDVSSEVLAQWEKANALFKHPIICTKSSLERRLEKEWERARLVARGRAKKSQREDFESKLDKLLDPLVCSCQPIQLCRDAGCHGPKADPPCKLGAHLDCTCPRENKIPKLELEFIKTQREKIGEKGGMQISLADSKEDARQKNAEARKVKDSRGVRDTNQKLTDLELEERKKEEEMRNDEEENNNQNEEEFLIAPVKTKWMNNMDLTGTAQTSMRYELSVRSTAAVASAYLGDLIRAGEISPSKSYLAVDPRKLQRARDKVLEEATECGEALTDADSIRNVMFDSRIDKTKVRKFDEETGKFYPRIESEDHYTLTDGEGRFLVHITKPDKNKQKEMEEGADEGEDEDESGTVEETAEERERKERLEEIVGAKEPKPAKVVAALMYEWMTLHWVDKTIQSLSGESTNSNTGYKGGIIAWLEKMLGRKVTWLICQLHTNELGLRHLFEELDGKTNSSTGWSGELGKKLKTVDSMERDYSFKVINKGPELIELPENVLKDLSTDQSLLYKLAKAVRSGMLPRDIALRKVGTMVHSRWLTFAESNLLMWMSKHGLTGELLDRLETIVSYLVSTYIPMWFQIKVKNSWLYGPRHVLTHLQLLKLQSPSVQTILMPYLRTSSWYAHSEAVLQTMLCSEDQEERIFAVTKILKIRGKEEFGKTKPRYRKLPQLNTEAKNLLELISWNRAHEPLLTCNMSKKEITGFKEKPMVVEDYCGHTQAIERAVKEVTAASAAVFGEERRDGWIRSRAENREIMPIVNTKKDLLKLLPAE